jgi:DNA repair exonuclease SbcCD ATPase subunit
MAALEQLIQQLDTGTRVAPATGTDAPSDLEWQLAQARKEEINARRELLNLEALLATKVNTLKANRSSEQARQELLQAENDLEAAKAQLNLQSSEVKRLEDKLSEIQLQASEGRLSTAAAARERELMYDKLKYLKHLAVGVNLYADKNAGRLPNNLKEALAIHGTDAPPGFVLEAFELVCRGRMQEIQDATQTIIIREKAAVKTRDRKWMKCYAFADGHTEVHVESTGQFEAWEKPRLKQP